MEVCLRAQEQQVRMRMKKREKRPHKVSRVDAKKPFQREKVRESEKEAFYTFFVHLFPPWSELERARVDCEPIPLRKLFPPGTKARFSTESDAKKKEMGFLP